MPTTIQLHPYQNDAKRQLVKKLESHDSVALQMATGSGKTVVFSSIAIDYAIAGKRVLILSHRREIINKTANLLWVMRPGSAAKIMPGVTACPAAPIQVASVQTLANRSHLPPSDLVIIDEAHHTPADSYQKILSHYPNAKVIGVTATPKDLAGYFKALVCGPAPSKLIAEGFLSPMRSLAASAQVSTKDIRTVADGDYDPEMIAANVGKIMGAIVPSWQTHLMGKSTLVFTASIASAHQVAQQYRNHGIHAEVLTDKTADRDRILKDFEERKFLVLVSVGILTEGTDIPGVEAIQCLRPTTSIVLWFQILGRAMRTAQGKNECWLLDHTDNWAIHGLPEDDHIWTLNGAKRRKKRPANPTTSARSSQPPIETLPAPLSEISDRADRLNASIARWLEIQRVKRYKPGWVVLRFQQNFPTASIEECDRLRHALGYEPGWEKAIHAGLKGNQSPTRPIAQATTILKMLFE